MAQASQSSAETAATEKDSDTQAKQTTPREFPLTLEDRWIGEGISYGPYREGQAPGGANPTREHLAEDLHLLNEHWNLLRMYGSGTVTEQVLQIIREDKIPMRVMVGAWIGPEIPSESLDANEAAAGKRANQSQVAGAIKLANKYPNEVTAISVGNETQVFWSDHITQAQTLIKYLREVRQATSQPVTTADDFNFWNKPESQAIAAEVDFIVTHIHAMWGGLLPETAMPWTKKIYREICGHHPSKLVVIGEAGWATQVHTEGEQAKLIKGPADEATQKLYFEQFTDWAKQEKICTFFFEAFDEPWKGGAHPNEVEKHWGLFHVDRSPKAALKAE